MTDQVDFQIRREQELSCPHPALPQVSRLATVNNTIYFPVSDRVATPERPRGTRGETRGETPFVNLVVA